MKLTGLLVPIVTPFTSNDTIDFDALKTLINTLIDAGVRGIIACGTTGEYYALTAEERHALMAFIADTVGERALLIAGVNDTYTKGSIEKAEAAKALGYKALMLAPSIYCLPQEEEIILHYRSVADATDMPIIMYNYPARSGVEISIDAVKALSQHPNIVGLKESSGDFTRALTLLNAGLENFDIICGSDDQAADYFFWGAKSWISGTTNYLPKQQVQMLDAALNEDFVSARQIMARMMPVIQNMESADYNQKAKLGCAHVGTPVGEIRAPLLPISNEDKAVFIDALDYCLK